MISYDGFIIPRVLEFVSPFWGKISYNLPYEKVGNSEPICIADEVPFEIPDSWEWCRINSLGSIIRGCGIKRTETVESGFPCVRYGELYTTYNTSFESTVSFVSEDLFNKCKQFHYGDVIFTLTGENKQDIAKTAAYLGGEPVAAGGDLAYWTAHGMNPLFLSYMMASPYLISRKVSLATGDIIIHISGDKIGSILMPVPPLNEQERIVNKLLEIEPLITEYGYKQNRSIDLDASFVSALKKSILQEAVQGKLVPQDENDEPASVLLERIRQEKDALVKAGKIKKDKHESVIFRRDNSHYEKRGSEEVCIDDELPFEIPTSWQWCRLGNLLSVKGGKRIPKGYDLLDTPTEHIYIRVTDMKNNTLITDKLKYISNDVYEQIKHYTISKDDLYLTIAGTIGNAGIVPDSFDGMNLTENAVKLTNISIDKFFLLHLLCSPLVQEQFIDKTNKVAQPKLAIERILTTLVPLPPVAEQKRITSALTELLSKINTL